MTHLDVDSIGPTKPSAPENAPLQSSKSAAPHVFKDTIESGVAISDLIQAIGNSKREFGDLLTLMAYLDPSLRKDIYRELAEKANAIAEMDSQIQEQAILDNQLSQYQQAINMRLSQVDMAALEQERKKFNDAIDKYNKDGDIDAFHKAFLEYTYSPAFQKAGTYDAIVRDYNQKVTDNIAAKQELGMPIPSLAAPLELDKEVVPLWKQERPLSHLPDLKKDSIPSQVPLSPKMTPAEAKAAYGGLVAARLQDLFAYKEQILSLMKSQEALKETMTNPDDITLPAGFMKKAPDAYVESSAGVSDSSTVMMMATIAGSNYPFLDELLSRVVYQALMREENLPPSPKLQEKLQIFMGQLLKQVTSMAGAAPSLLERAELSGRSRNEADRLYDLARANAYAASIRDLIASGVIEENVGHLIATNPDYASLSAVEKRDMVAPFCAVCHAAFLKAALSHVGISLGEPNLALTVLGTISYVPKMPQANRAARIRNVLKNPVSQLFLKTMIGSRVDPKKANRVVNRVVSQLDRLNSEADLRAALLKSLKEEGIEDSNLFDRAAFFIKAASTLHNLDTPYISRSPASVARFLGSPPSPDLEHAYPSGTPRGDRLQRVNQEAQADVAVHNALRKILSSTYETNHEFFAELYEELLAGGVPAEKSGEIAALATGLFVPEELQVEKRSIPELGDHLAKVVSKRLEGGDAEEIKGMAEQFVKIIVGPNSLRSVLNEQFRVLQEEGVGSAAEELASSIDNISSSHLYVGQLAFKRSIDSLIDEQVRKF